MGRKQLDFYFSRGFAARSRALRARISRLRRSCARPDKTAMLRRLHVTSMSRHQSRQYGHVVLVSGYPVLTSVNYPQQQVVTLRECANRWTEVCGGIGSQRMRQRKMAPILKITIVLVICSIFVECRSDKVFFVICEIGLKANKSQIIHNFDC